MPEPQPAPRRRLSRGWIALFVLAVLVLAGAFAWHRYSQPEKLSALLVAQARSRFDIDLSMDGAGRFRFSPNLQLQLSHPVLAAASDGAALLRAERIDVSLPWRVLWSERIDIERIDLQRPTVDIEALSRWLERRPGGATPDVRFALRVQEGTLLAGDTPLAEGVDLQLRNSDDLAAWLAGLQHDSAAVPLPPLGGSASARSLQIGTTRIEGLKVEVKEDPPAVPANSR